jgi:hypothetical protein
MCKHRRYDISLKEERWLALERLRRICLAGLVSVRDFRCSKSYSGRAGDSTSPLTIARKEALVRIDKILRFHTGTTPTESLQ